MYGLRDFALPSQVVHMYTQLLRSRIRPSLIVVMKQRRTQKITRLEGLHFFFFFQMYDLDRIYQPPKRKETIQKNEHHPMYIDASFFLSVACMINSST